MSNGKLTPQGDTANQTLRDYIWQPLIDVETGFSGTLRGSSEKGQMYFALVSSTGQRQMIQPGAQLLHPASRLLLSVGAGFTLPSAHTASESDLERFGLSAAGGTGSTAWSSTQAAQTQADAAAMERLRAQLAQDQASLAENKRQFDIAQANDDRRQMEMLAQQMKLEEMRIENSKRELLYSQIGEGTRTVFQAQEAERGRQQEMAGEDAFRFTATLRGRGTAGQTPTDIFKQQGAGFVNQPLPQFSINDPIPTLEAGLQALQKMGVSGAPQGLIPGMAQGGTVGQGPFGVVPAWVGEDGPELALLAPGSSIVPLDQIAGAQGGINIPGLDFGGFPDLLESLRRSTGLGGFLAQPGFGGETLSVRDILLPGQASALGAFQRPVGSLFQARPSGGDPTGAVFMMDPSGQRRGITPGASGAFDLKETQFMLPQQISRIPRGADIRDPSFTLPLPNYEGAFGALGQPLDIRQGLLELAAVNPSFSRQDAINLSNTIGFLPAPHKIAREFMLLDPTEQQGLMSLYNLAGFPAASFQRIIGAATPQAGAFGGRRIGFTGGFM